MSESINAEFEAYVKAELGDIAVVSDGRFISPKIQNYYKIWQHLQAKIEAQFTPITAGMVTPKMIVECNNNLDGAISLDEFAAAVNAYMGARR